MKKNLFFLMAMLCTISSYAVTIIAEGGPGINVKIWGQASSWNLNRVPTATDDVVIPANAEVSIGSGTPNITVNSITVEGKLTVNNSLASLNLRTKYMMIMGASAAFTWGTEQNPFNGKGTLTLLGQNSTEFIPGTTSFSKGIMVMGGGLLEIHGKYQRSWSRLGVTANATATTLTLAADLSITGWAIGDSIVVASTDYDNNHAEKFEITNINTTTKLVTIDNPLNWKHFGQKLSYQNSAKQFDQRAEVGLITRNITIQGEFIAGTPLGYGGYIMSMDMSNTRLSNVNLLNMGQNGNKGSYPMHWHLAGAKTNNFIKNSVIRNSFNRGVVLHSTDNVEVDSNVLYQHRGHGYMLEDGDEENNFFRNNLGLGTLAPRNAGLAVEASEMEPATYWITNPNNTFNGNVAAGSINTGFWIIPVSTVLRNTDLRKAAGYSPRAFKLKSFVNNVGHSCRLRNLALEGNMTFSVVNGKVVKSEALFDPRYPETDVSGVTLKHVFTNFTSYKGAQNGVWTRAGVTNEFIGCYFGEASFMAFLSYNAIVTNSVFHALTLNTSSGTPLDKPNQDVILGFQMYNGSTDISGVHFAGFNDPSKAICIGNRQSSGKFPNFKADNITFETSDDTNVSLNKVDFAYKSPTEDPSKSTLFVAGLIDVDGSISGINGGRITPRIYNTKPNDNKYNNRIFDSNFNIPNLAGNRTFNSKWSAYVTTNTRYGILHNFMGWGENTGTNEDRFIYAIRSDGPATFDQLRLGHDSQLPIILEERNGPGGAIREDIIYATQFHETPNRIQSDFKWTSIGANTIAAFLNVPSTTNVYVGAKTSPAQLPSTLPQLPYRTTLANLKSNASRGYTIVDNTLYIKYVATEPDADTNTSGVSIDYSSLDIHIDLNSAGSNTGLQNFVTLADFNSNAVDARGSLAKTAGGIDFDPITATANTNKFTITKGASATDFVDYNFTLTNEQIWKEFKKITINYQGPQAELMLRDDLNSTNWVTVKTIPNTSTLTTYDIPLNAINITNLDRIKQLKLRFRQEAMLAGQNTFNVVLDRMALSLEPATINTAALSVATNNEVLSLQPSTSEITVYPNPASGIFNIQLGNTLTDLNIYDLSGKIVFTKKDVKGLISISTSEIGVAGTYLIRTNNGTTKLVIVNQ